MDSSFHLMRLKFRVSLRSSISSLPELLTLNIRSMLDPCISVAGPAWPRSMESASWSPILVLLHFFLEHSFAEISNPQTSIRSLCRNGHQSAPRPVAAFRDDRRQAPWRYHYYHRRYLPGDLAGLSADPGVRADIPQSTMGIRRYHPTRRDGMQLKEIDILCKRC